MLDGVQFDEEDRSMVERFKWRLSPYGYACAQPYIHKVRRVILMHRLIMWARPGQIVDHINCDKLDNRRCNLRFCTPSQNNMNRPSKTGMPKGIYWDAQCKSWAANVSANGRKVWFERFRDYDEAVKARHAAILHYHGEFARPI